MRKVYLAILLLLSGLAGHSQCVDLVHEDFESLNFSPGWTLPGGYTYFFNGAPSPVGTFHAQITGGGSHYGGPVLNFSASTPAYISWWGKTASLSTNSSYVVIGDASTTSNNGIVFFYFKANGNMLFYNNGIDNYEVPAQANVWYHFELKNIDYVNKTFDLFVDGVMVRQGFPFRSQSTTAISQIHLYNFSSGVTGYYDDIIIGSQAVEASGMVDHVDCYGEAQGTAWVDVTSGQGPFTYSWSNGGSSDTISGLVAGNYQAIVTSVNGCADTVSLTINEPPALGGSFLAVDPMCSYSSDGSLEYLATGGSPGYAYFWSHGDSVSLAQGLSGGTYSVTLMDANGCLHQDTTSLNAPAPIVTSGTVTNEVGGVTLGAIDLQVGGGTPGYSYAWSTGDTTEDVQGLTAGAYTVQVTDLNGCVAIDTFVVEFLVSNNSALEMNVKVWPVPFEDSFNVILNGSTNTMTIELLDLRGSVLIRKECTGAQSQEIPTQGVAAGTYLLRISNGLEVQVMRLVKN